jgi:hypothetical protein
VGPKTDCDERKNLLSLSGIEPNIVWYRAPRLVTIVVSRYIVRVRSVGTSPLKSIRVITVSASLVTCGRLSMLPAMQKAPTGTLVPVMACRSQHNACLSTPQLPVA